MDKHTERRLPIVPASASLKALRQAKVDLHAKMTAIVDKLASDKTLSAEDKATLRSDLKTDQAAFDENNELLASAEALNEAQRSMAPVNDPDVAAGAGGAAAAQVELGINRVELDSKRGFASHTDQLDAIMKTGQTGVVDSRLKHLAAAGADEAGGHTNPHGAFLLAPAFAPDLLSVQGEVDPLAGRVRAIPMTADRVVFNARVDKHHATSVSGGLTVSRTPETKAVSTSRTEFEQVELVARDLCGAGFATNRILQTSPISFLALLQSGFRDEFASKLIDERLNGTGVSEFDGVIRAACTIAVAKESGQAADTITFANINTMRARCWRYGDAVWLANHDTLPQVTTLTMPIGTGGVHIPIYAPGKEDAPQGTLLGRPIFFTEFCQTLGDKGDIVLGVWSEFLEGTLGAMEQSSSIHVRFLNREEAFLFVLRNDGKPWWRSALTPKYSAVMLSPFVVLANRA